MKKRIYSQIMPWRKCLVIALISILFAANVSAQLIAFYPLTSSKAITGNTPPGTAWAAKTAAGVTTGTASVGVNITDEPTGDFKSQGIELKTTGDDNSGNGIEAWPGGPLYDSFSVSLPLSPVAGNDIHLTDISFTTDSAGQNDFNTAFTIMIQPYYQVDGTGPWEPLSNAVGISATTPQNTMFNLPVNNVFYSGHSYVVRFFLYSTNGATKEDDILIDNVLFNGTVVSPPAVAPTVTLTNAVAAGKYTGDATGTYQSGNGYYLSTQSGVVWSTSPNPTLGTLFTTDGINGIINAGDANNITGLTANTTYYVKGYIITQFGVTYSNQLSFTTAPTSIPSVSINLTSIASNKAGVTGNITDSGGLVISQKGFIWSTTGAPTLTSYIGKQYEGSGTATFSDFIKGLKPSTNYCVSTYATNSKGTSISPDTCFMTSPPAPTLTAIPGTIDFGQNYYQSSPLILSYTLTGSDLSGAPITITAPAGFIISTSPNFGAAAPGNTIILTTAVTPTYSGATLSATPIYVEMPTTAYGTFAGNIIHSGGGVTLAANADMVALTGSVVQSPIDVSNTGTDFWLGFGFEQDMKEAIDNTEANGVNRKGANMYVYISGVPGTPVTVEMPLDPGAFPTLNTVIPAAGFLQVTGFLQGSETDETNAAGLPDARLYYTGVTNRGIHVSSQGGPISVWLYDYATNSSAGGALVFPTNTWNSNYTVQAYGNTANNGNGGSGPSNSFFFVIADQDNTPVYFTPTVDIIDSSVCSQFINGAATDLPANVKYAAGVTDTIYLNKGQVFNALGGLNTTLFGLDLSGTTVSTDCDKKIAVFGGNGRCVTSTPVYCTAPTSGSDNMVQQMVPSVAWDTKYFTVPTKTMERNLFRIYVKNAATKVWINDTTHTLATSLLTSAGTTLAALDQISNPTGKYTYTSFPNGNGGYYAIETSAPMDIESDQPINVIQFITSCSGNAVVGDNGSGDPEMIILTGAQQAITSATVYSPIFQNGDAGGAYINIVIPKAGVSTFKLDAASNPTQMVDTGSSSYTGTAYAAAALIPIANAFKPYPSNPNYYWAKFHVSYPAIHTISSTVSFNGIAYGVADGESYGFNAGTQVKDLSSIQFTSNPNGGDSSATAVRTCVGNPVTLKIALPFIPSLVDSIIWNPQDDPRILDSSSRKGAMNGTVAKYDDSIIVNGRTFYVYSSPVQYTFTELGTYRFPVTAYGTFASDCPGEDIENMLVIVGSDQDNLTFEASCGSPAVTLSSDTIPAAGTNILKWTWNFGDNSTPVSGGNLTDTVHTYPPGGSIYTVKLTTINSVGCVSTDSVQVDFSGGLKASYTTSTNAVCTGSSITFTDNSAASGISGTPNKWTWNFGDGSNLDSVTGATITHPFTKAGRFAVTLKVNTTAGCVDYFIDSVTIEATPVAAFTAASACLGNSNTFMNNSTVPNNLGTVDSSFWDFGDGIKDTTIGLSSATHIYSTAGAYTTTLYVKSDGGCSSTPVTQKDTAFALPVGGFKDSVDCANLLVTFTDTSNANGGTIKEWDWNLGDGTDTTTTTAGIVFKHSYPNGSGQTFHVTLTVITTAGCTNPVPASGTFGIGAAPIASFTLASGALCLPNASVTFNNTSVPNDGSNPVNPLSYSWNFGDATDSSITAGPPTSVTHIYTGTGPYNVTLTATSNKGCISTFALIPSLSINPQPVATISALPVDCLNDSLAFVGNATANQWDWDFGDNSGTDTRQAPNYEWKAPGTYVVSLTITSAAGCKSVPADSTITVDSLPTPGFTISPDCITDLVTFTDTSNAHGGTITEWDWNFGDGSPDSIIKIKTASFAHLYANGNGKSFTVKLSVKTKDGCSNPIPDSATFGIGASPDPQFSLAPGLLCLPNAAVTFVNNTTISDGSIDSVSYVWKWGDGISPDSVVSGLPPAPPASATTHIYPGTGPYTVILVASSNKGCASSDTLILKTINPQPVAVINAPAAVCLNDSASLSGNGANTTSAWAWDFGDNVGTSTLQAPKYAWSASKKYGISLIVTSTVGCKSAPTIDSITVNPLPVADFIISQPALCAKNVIAFTDASSSDVSINTWNWNFGDGSTPPSSIQNPSYTYATDGPYTVGLIVTDANGCSNTPAHDSVITVNPLPQPGFAIPVICISTGSTTFTANTTGNAVSWTWGFFDGNAPLTGSSVPYTYAAGGPDSVRLIEASAAGCIDSLTQNDTAYNVPTAKDSIENDTALCSNMSVYLVNESSVNGYGSISKIDIYWNYITGASTTPDITDNTPTGTYSNKYQSLSADNNYIIRLDAFSGNGCPTQPYYDTITVHGSPTVTFAPLAPVCQGIATFALTGGAQVSNLQGLTDTYTGTYSGIAGVIGDSLFSPQQAGPGTFPIIYTFVSSNGCFDTAVQTISVYPEPSVNYGTVQSVLEGDSITLNPVTPPSSAGLLYMWVPAIYLNTDTSATPISKPADSVTYTITVTAPGTVTPTSPTGCQASTTLLVQVLRDFMVPNTFTPNNDGINDTWVIAELPKYPIQWVQVFDRYGQLLYESHGYSTPWDGTYKGHQLPAGTYYYIIELGGLVSPKTGYVTILR